MIVTDAMKAAALTRCRVYFSDGNSVLFYSLDGKGKKKSLAYGMANFEKMLNGTFKGKWDVALIYENKPNGMLLAKYLNGVRIA